MAYLGKAFKEFERCVIIIRCFVCSQRGLSKRKVNDLYSLVQSQPSAYSAASVLKIYTNCEYTYVQCCGIVWWGTSSQLSEQMRELCISLCLLLQWMFAVQLALAPKRTMAYHQHRCHFIHIRQLNTFSRALKPPLIHVGLYNYCQDPSKQLTHVFVLYLLTSNNIIVLTQLTNGGGKFTVTREEAALLHSEHRTCITIRTCMRAFYQNYTCTHTSLTGIS